MFKRERFFGFLFALVVSLYVFEAVADETEPLLSLGKGLVGCYEARGRLHRNFDESGTCGKRYKKEESIWVRQSKNQTIRASVRYSKRTSDVGRLNLGDIHWRDERNRQCHLTVSYDLTEDDALVGVLFPLAWTAGADPKYVKDPCGKNVPQSEADNFILNTAVQLEWSGESIDSSPHFKWVSFPSLPDKIREIAARVKQAHDGEDVEAEIDTDQTYRIQMANGDLAGYVVAVTIFRGRGSDREWLEYHECFLNRDGRVIFKHLGEH